jgi:hypothetical protein
LNFSLKKFCIFFLKQNNIEECRRKIGLLKSALKTAKEKKLEGN